VRKSRGAEIWDAILITAAVWVLALALWLEIRFLGGTLGRISTESMNVHGDFDTFWRSARAFWEGRDVYATGAELENLNPPLWVCSSRRSGCWSHSSRTASSYSSR
jgi:hypothetical protein